MSAQHVTHRVTHTPEGPFPQQHPSPEVVYYFLRSIPSPAINPAVWVTSGPGASSHLSPLFQESFFQLHC